MLKRRGDRILYPSKYNNISATCTPGSIFLKTVDLKCKGNLLETAKVKDSKKHFFFIWEKLFGWGSLFFGNGHHNKPQTTEWKMFELKLLSNLKIGILRGRRLKELEGGFINIGRRNQSGIANILGRWYPNHPNTRKHITNFILTNRSIIGVGPSFSCISNLTLISRALIST